MITQSRQFNRLLIVAALAVVTIAFGQTRPAARTATIVGSQPFRQYKIGDRGVAYEYGFMVQLYTQNGYIYMLERDPNNPDNFIACEFIYWGDLNGSMMAAQTEAVMRTKFPRWPNNN